MVLTLLLLVSLVAAYWLRWRHLHKRMLKAADQFPGPKTLPGLGNALMFVGGPEVLITVIKKLQLIHGRIYKFWLGPDLNIVISDPVEIKALLTNPKLSYKGPQYKYMKRVLGEGILSGSGPIWRKHRKIANPNYGKRAIESYSAIFNREVELLLRKFRSLEDEEQYDMYKYVVQATSYVVCQTLMGLTKEQTMKLPYIQEIIDVTPELYDIIFDRMTKWYLQIDPVFWMSKQNKDLEHSISMITQFSADILRYRKEHLQTIGKAFKTKHMEMTEDASLSVIDRFILSKNLNEEELLEETFTIFTSSQEASAKISSYLLLMMAYHPECQEASAKGNGRGSDILWLVLIRSVRRGSIIKEKLYNEILTVIGDSDRDVTDEDIKNMPYLEMAFREVLRLYPIGALLQRTVTEDIPLNSGLLPAGSSLMVPIYHLHRDSRYWDDPDAFDPERFNVENVNKRHPYAYIPFSLGPMDCLGRFFGTKLVKTLCVRVLREFQVTSLRSYKDFKVIIAISVISANGYYAKLTPRQKP